MLRNNVFIFFAVFNMVIMKSALSGDFGHPSFYSHRTAVQSHFTPVKASNLVNYDINSGALITSFDIPVKHAAKDLINKLTASYSSFLNQNTGLGIGVKLSLPRFYKNPSQIRSNFILEYNNKVVEYRVKNKVGYEIDITLFSSLIEEDDKYVIRFPSGKKLYFSKDTGNILKEVSSFNKSFVEFKWNDSGLLEEIKSYNGTKLNFEYDNCDFVSSEYKSSFSYRAFIAGRVVDTSKCLGNIDVNGKKIEFKYDDGHLSKVYWEDAIDLPLFEATYGDDLNEIKTKYNVYGESDEDTTALKLGSHGVRFIKNSDLLKKFGFLSATSEIKFRTSATISFVKEADLNHDGISDLILETIDHVQGVRFLPDPIFSKYNYRKSDNSKASIPKFKRKDVFIAYGKLNDSKDDIQFYTDPKASIPKSFNTMSPNCLFTIDYKTSKPFTSRCNNSSMDHWDKYTSGTAYKNNEPSSNYRALLLKKSSILIGDFNGDRFVDILYCSTKRKSILYGSVDGFASESEVDFPCSNHSSSQDINKDGFADIISSDGVYLNLNQKFIKIENEHLGPVVDALNDQQLLQNFTALSEDDIQMWKSAEDKTLSYGEHLRNIKGKKIHFDVKKNEYFYDDEDHKSQMLTSLNLSSGAYLFTGKESEGEYISTGSKKRIQSLRTLLGATTKISYAPIGSSPITAQVTKSNLTEELKEDLYFSQPIISGLYGNFLGYKFLRKVTSATSNTDGSEKIFHFYSDSAKKDLLVRSPIHGQVAELINCKLDTCPNLVSFISKPTNLSIPLLESESFLLNKWNVLFGKNIGDMFKAEQYLKRNYLVTDAISVGLVDSSAFMSLESKSIFSDFSHLGPLTVVQEKNIGIKSDSFGTDLSGTSIFEKTIIKKVVRNNVLLNDSIVKFKVDGSNKPVGKTLFEYSGLYGTAGFEAVSKSYTDAEYVKVSKQFYDDFGRVVKTVSPRGSVENIAYSLDEKNIIKTDDRQSIEENYSDLGELLNSTTVDLKTGVAHTNVSLEYSSMGAIKKITQNDELLNIDMNVSDNIDLTFTYSKNGKVQRVVTKSLDHLGQTVLEKQTVQGVESLILKEIFDASGKKIKSFLPQLNSTQEIEQFDYMYDFAQRITTKNNLLLSQDEKWSYDKNYKSYFKNSKLISKEEMMPGGLRSHIYRGDNKHIALEDDFQEGIDALYFEDLSLKYNRNFDGGVTSVTNHDLVELFSQKETLFSITTDDVSKVFINKYGNLSKAQSMTDSYKFKFDSRDRLETFSTDSYIATAKYSDDGDLKSNEFNFTQSKLSYKEEYDYNELGLASNVNLHVNKKNFIISNKYEGFNLSSVDGLVDRITYSASGAVKSIKYSSGLKIDYKRDLLGQLEEFIVTEKDGSIKKESYKRNNDNLISFMETNLSIDKSTKSKSYEYTSDFQFLGKASKSTDGSERDEFLSETKNILSHKSSIVQYEDRVINYGVGTLITGAFANFGQLKDEFLKSDLHFINNAFVKYIEVNGSPIGAIIFKDGSSSFYPIVTDVRGSVRLAYNSAGELVLLKNYDDWGYLDRSDFVNKDDIDKFIVLDYARLKRMDTKSDYLLSNNRIYNSSTGKWASIDPLLLKSAETLLDNRFYEIDGLSYAAGDPINYIDPSGKSAESLFLGYMKAGLTDLGHYLKFQGMSMYENIAGVFNSEITGGGFRPSFSASKVLSLSCRLGYDTSSGIEAFGESSYNFGRFKGVGQFGYSSGGVRLNARVDGGSKKASSAITLGTSNNIRGKIGYKDYFQAQYNTSGAGRVDFGMKYRGVGLGGYLNLRLSSESYNNFQQSSSYSNWSYSGMPYGGSAW